MATMKAIVFHEYGSADVLRCEEIEKPTPGDHDVLLKVRAAAVNPLDWHVMRGKPYVVRLFSGIRTPTFRIGVDVSGQVEAVGREVTAFRPGDEVFGSCRQAFAEYACTSETALVKKPRNLTFGQAASAPVAAFTALQGLRDKGRLQPGQRVLINGASGGIGTFAVQIAKSFGANVTGVCSTRNVEMVRSIGADSVVDYTREDFTRSGSRYDLLLDCIGNRSLSACRRVLTARGTYVGVAAPKGEWIGLLLQFIKTLVVSRFVSQRLVGLLAKPNKEDLATVSGLMEAGKVRPVIDRQYQLSETAEAIRYLEAGHVRGKVVVTMNGEVR
jgi:NADPH:quinone reductase-like Zn-dependent oxidoreductase